MLDKFDMVTIPSGHFLMGDEFTHTSSFQISRTPITNRQYLLFTNSTAHKPPCHWDNGYPPEDKMDHPVVYVSWYDVRVFCDWLQRKTGRLFTLPSEAKWEKAARGTDDRIYPWGDEEPTPDLCNFGNNVGDTTPVGAYPKGASPYGLLDCAGNVWEWAMSACENSSLRALRGGSFDSKASMLSCSARLRHMESYCSNNIGFRIVLL